MATRRSPLPALALTLALLLAVTNGRVRQMQLKTEVDQGLIEGSKSELKIKNLLTLIQMLTSRQRVEMEMQGQSQSPPSESQLEKKNAFYSDNNAQKRSEVVTNSTHSLQFSMHKRQVLDTDTDHQGEHLNPTDFINAKNMDKENTDRPEGSHDPTENKDGSKQNLIEGDIIPNERQARNMIMNPDERWLRGEVPYTIASGFTSSERAAIASAVLEFERNTCIRVRPLAPSDNADDGYVHIIKGDGCYSSVGRQQSPGQELSIGNGCLYPGIIMHEFMHALGFWHEQSRPDRDDHVRIHFNNIQDGKEYNFKQYSWNQVQSLKQPYDVGSIMHYGPHAFARDRSRPTITALKQTSVTMGQREGLSRKDINKINKLYKCKDATAPPTPIVRPAECTDRGMYCKEWTSTGECTKNPLYMKMHCAKSCDSCSSESCQDLNNHCAAWAETGECTSTPSYMSLYCKQSCGVCEGSSNVGCTDVSPFCKAWAKQGECQKNPDYMNVGCKKACKVC